MQLTRFDRWLRETFVHEIQIQTLSPVDPLPKGIRRLPDDTTGKRYKYFYLATSTAASDRLTQQLKHNNQMYQMHVTDRDAWFVPIIAPKNKSITWWVFSMTIICIASFLILSYLKTLIDDPIFRKNFMESLDILKK